MAHAKIYQISRNPVDRDDYVEPDNFYDNHDSYADYIGNKVEGDKRKECLEYLAKDLQEIFDLDGETLVFKGKPALKAFKQKWVDAIQKQAQEVTVENVARHTPRLAICNFAEDTHKAVSDRFCIEEWSGMYAEPTAELIDFVGRNLRKGQRLYIGAIIDFHY